MKKIVLTFVALAAMTVASAQQVDNQKERKAPRKPTPEMMVERMSKELDLTDDQKTKLVAAQKDYEAKVKEILTDDQYKKYQQMGRRGGRPGGGQGRHGNRPNGPRPEKQEKD